MVEYYLVTIKCSITHLILLFHQTIKPDSVTRIKLSFTWSPLLNRKKKKKVAPFKIIYTHQESCNHYFVGHIRDSILLLPPTSNLHDKFGLDHIRELIAISTLAKNSIINALEDCCELLASFFTFTIAW